MRSTHYDNVNGQEEHLMKNYKGVYTEYVKNITYACKTSRKVYKIGVEMYPFERGTLIWNNMTIWVDLDKVYDISELSNSYIDKIVIQQILESHTDKVVRRKITIDHIKNRIKQKKKNRLQKFIEEIFFKIKLLYG